MILVAAGMALGLAAMWLYSKLADIPALAEIKSQKRERMRRALKHQGSFAELLQIQKSMLALSFTHLRRIFFPALISAAPLIILLALRPDFATLSFGVGVGVAYVFAKWRWRL